MAAEFRFNIDEDDENEDEQDSSIPAQFGSKDGLLFLIDCSKSMFVKEHDDEDSAFEICVKEKSSAGIEFKHVYVLQDLKLPGADEIRQLEKLLEGNNDDFDNNYGHSEDYSLADALWTCSNIFANCSQKLGFKRILLFTNNDNPHSDGQLKRQAMTKFEDLQQNGIELELMHMSPPDKPFDLQAFYKDILYADDDEQIVIPDPAEKFEELLTRVRAKNYKKRAMTRIPLSIADGFSLSVGVYTLVRSCTKPSAVKLYKKTNEEVKHVTKTFLKENGEILMPQDMRKSQTYAGKQITLEPEEVVQMKTFSTPGLELMGFKPKNMIKPYFHVHAAQFIYPDESNVKGSTVLFTALLKKCVEKGVVAICRYTQRRSMPPRFVALFPQFEELDDRKVQVVPPGFHVVFLPFADDFRKLKLDEKLPRANAEQIDKAKELIKKLQFAFRSESFENPGLQKHFANVEALALDRENVDELQDFTLPDDEKIEKRAGKISQEFKSLVFPDDYQPGSKRKAGGGAAAKSSNADDLDIDIEQEARENRLGKLTVNVLKECAKKLKLKTVGVKKADIIDAISDYFGL